MRIFFYLLLLFLHTLSTLTSSFSVLSSILLQDLERVVVRQPRLSEYEHAERNVSRRNYVTIEDDTDGCERGILMINRWRNSKTNNPRIPMQAYEVMACALVENRWRTRWRLKKDTTATSSTTSSSDAAATSSTLTNTAEQLLQLYEWMKQDEMEPSDVFLEAVLAGLASCSSPKTDRQYGSVAHEIFLAHSDNHEKNDMTKDHHSFQQKLIFHIIRGYCWQQENKSSPECAQAADELYAQLQGSSTYDAPARRLLVEAWSKALHGAERCQALFDTFQNDVPQDVWINTVLAWTKQPGGAARAEALLLSSSKDINDSSSDNDGENKMSLNQIAMQAIVSAWAREGRPDRAEALIPFYCESTTRCINSVLHGWLQWDDKDVALKRIKTIIKNMERPNAFTYATLIKAYRQASPGHAEGAMEAWGRLVALRAAGDKSITTSAVLLTNIALNVCAKAADGNRAMQLLRDHTKATGTKPDTISYTTVLQALANDSADVSEELIVKLFETCQEPNARTYAMAILALANHGGSPATAYEILVRGHPHEYSHPYNYVLKCCNNSHDPNSFRIAAKTFKLIPTPDSFSYSTWLRCIQNLIPKDDTANLRERCLRHAAAGAKRHGCWENETVQTRFAQCCPKELRAEFMM